jgi:3-carboxy-cis,cis-muconate cycloisomerase
MPHKRNPVGTVLAIACARQVDGAALVLISSGAQEHERGVGGWQAEWPALSSALAYTGGAAAAVRETLARLEVHPERMAANLGLAGGLVGAERASFLLAGSLGRENAQKLVAEAATRARTNGSSLLDELAWDERVELSREELAAALAPAAHLGSAEAFVDRALRLYRDERAAV